MSAFETVETQIPLLNSDNFEPPAQPNWGIRDRLFNTRAGRSFAALITTLGMSGVGELAWADAADASTLAGPLKPTQAQFQIRRYFDIMYPNSVVADLMNVTYDTVGSHHLVMHGLCPDPNQADNTILQTINDTPSAQFNVTCPTKDQKRHVTYRYPRRLMISPEERKLTYVPLLQQLGERAARSAGLTDNQHGDAQHIFASRSELDVTYGKSNTASAGVKQLHMLRIHRGNGTSVIREGWYK